MSRPYITVPTVEKVMSDIANHLALIYRVSISYRIQHTNGDYECAEIENPNELHYNGKNHAS